VHSGAELARFDLEAYLRRIGYSGSLQASHATLAALHQAHATRIPFENLDILLGRPVRLDLNSLQAKLVMGNRGGYCFEQNILFAAALEQLGFTLTALAARVRHGAQLLRPRTHMLLLVEADSTRWIADVGFGGEGLLLPLAFDATTESRQYLWTYRVVDQAGQWAVQSLRDRCWIDLYAFTLEPQQGVDYEMANYYVSTHPDSPFVRMLTAQCVAPHARTMLRNRELTVDRGDTMTRRMLADDEEVLHVLSETFGLTFPAQTRFRYPEPSA
jgi:N-hydroxyarylamine O-acetyltransferase